MTEQGGTISKAAAVTLTAAPPVLTVSRLLRAPSHGTGATQQFTATGSLQRRWYRERDVTWTATGGTISTGGLYTAGATVGPYVVTATVTGGSIAGTAQ